MIIQNISLFWRLLSWVGLLNCMKEVTWSETEKGDRRLRWHSGDGSLTKVRMPPSSIHLPLQPHLWAESSHPHPQKLSAVETTAQSPHHTSVDEVLVMASLLACCLVWGVGVRWSQKSSMSLLNCASVIINVMAKVDSLLFSQCFLSDSQFYFSSNYLDLKPKVSSS